MTTCGNTGLEPDARLAACDAAMAQAQPASTADRAIIYLNLADASLGAGRLDAAIGHADASARLMDGYQPSQNMRCWTRAVANREIDIARAACTIAEDIRKDDPGVADSSGLVALREGDWQRAWVDYDRAFRLDGRMTASLYGRALAFLALGRMAEGEADLMRASGAAAEFGRYGLTPEGVKARAAGQPRKPGS